MIQHKQKFEWRFVGQQLAQNSDWQIGAIILLALLALILKLALFG